MRTWPSGQCRPVIAAGSDSAGGGRGAVGPGDRHRTGAYGALTIVCHAVVALVL